jgi:hypothetical protein
MVGPGGRDTVGMGTRAARVLRAMCLTAAAAAGVLTTFVPVAAAATRTLDAGSGTVWLCRPGQAADPCTSSRTATAVTGSGATSLSVSAPSPRARRFDCFSVYPTVSMEAANNADLTVQPAEVATAVAQASRFSQLCNVWAPMYRQATLAALVQGASTNPTVVATAYTSLLSAWKDHLAHDNHGRPAVFIGHSQGAPMLIKLLQAQVDPSRRPRRQMVSAASQTGCVIAYSTFGSPPPPDSVFGRAGRGVSLLSGQTSTEAQQVVCVNPATLSTRVGALQPYFRGRSARTPRVRVGTSWVTFHGLYTAQCERSGGASWLQVMATPAPGDPRPTVSAVLGPL